MKYIHRAFALLVAFALSLIYYPIGFTLFPIIAFSGWLGVLPAYYYVVKGRLPTKYENEKFNDFLQDYMDNVFSFFGKVLTKVGPKMSEVEK